MRQCTWSDWVVNVKLLDLLTKLCCRSAMPLGDASVSSLKVMAVASKTKKAKQSSLFLCGYTKKPNPERREIVCQVLSVLRRYTITEIIWLPHKPTTSLILVTTLTFKRHCSPKIFCLFPSTSLTFRCQILIRKELMECFSFFLFTQRLHVKVWKLNKPDVLIFQIAFVYFSLNTRFLLEIEKKFNNIVQTTESFPLIFY